MSKTTAPSVSGEHTRSDWEALARQALKSDDLDQLTRVTEDGIAIPPLFLAEDAPPILNDAFSAAASRGWNILQYIEPQDDAKALNRTILDELEGGASGIIMTADQNPSLLAKAMDGVYLNAIRLVFDAPLNACAVADVISDLWQAAGVNAADAKASLGMTAFADEKGEIKQSLSFADDLSGLMPLTQDWPGLRLVTIGGGKWHRFGLTPAQQIAAGLAELIAVMRMAEAAGLDLDDVYSSLEFQLAFDADLYHGIAKARALRLLMARVLASMGVDAADVAERCHAITADRMLNRIDTDTNILRNGTALLAAALSGFGQITVLPHDWLTGSSAQGRRVARNMHHLLADESQLTQVADPAQGSYYIDHLTDALAKKAWEFFQEIETKGGLAKALADGVIAAWAGQANDARQQQVNRGIRASLGVTLHPMRGALPKPIIQGINGQRGGEAREASVWEALRLDFHGQTPRCLMLDIGQVTDASAAVMTRWFAATGLDAAMMTAEDIPSAISILQSAKPDVLILGGALSEAMLNSDEAQAIATRFVASIDVISRDGPVNFAQLMLQIKEALL
jgi:methylmalonyl-CoA mutase